MKNAASFLIFAIPMVASAPPVDPGNTGGPLAGCMAPAQAHTVATYWTTLLGAYTKSFSESVLTSNYTDYSDSALSLNAVCPQASGTEPPLLNPVYTSRAQLEAGQGSQPSIKSNILKVWPPCTEVTMPYEMTNFGSGKRPVVGIIAIEVVPVR